VLVSLPALSVVTTSSSGVMTQSSLGWKKNGAEIRCLDVEFFTRCIVARNCPSVQASITSPMWTTNVPAARQRQENTYIVRLANIIRTLNRNETLEYLVFLLDFFIRIFFLIRIICFTISTH